MMKGFLWIMVFGVAQKMHKERGQKNLILTYMHARVGKKTRQHIRMQTRIWKNRVCIFVNINNYQLIDIPFRY